MDVEVCQQDDVSVHVTLNIYTELLDDLLSFRNLGTSKCEMLVNYGALYLSLQHMIPTEESDLNYHLLKLDVS